MSEKVKKSVCEIIKDGGFGSGFFCKIKFEENELCCLFSNNHVISEEMLSKREYLSIKLNNNIYNISLKLKRRIWSNKNIDFTCIEIIEEDNLLLNIEAFELDKNNYNTGYELENYDKRTIIVASLGEKGEIELPEGIIEYDKKNSERFFHNCNSQTGLSGGPIILNNNMRVVGINCGFEKNSKKNIGIYFKEIMKIIEKKIIKCVLDIKLNKKKVGILLFNQNSNNKKDIENNYKVYLNDRILEIKNLDNKYIINNVFEKEGEYEIKIDLKKNLTNLNSFFESLYRINIIRFIKL